MSASDYGCRQPVYNEHGAAYATRTSAPHDWRLFERELKHYSEYVQGNQPPGFGNIELTPEAWVETWYCAKCRAVDVRIAPIPVAVD